MALSDLQKLFVVSTATQLWQQDLLTNAYFQGSAVGANLREMVLGRQPVQPLTNPYDEAITGRLRADSATIRQAARNVQEASSMVGIAAGAVGTIKTTLEEMEDIAQQIKDGDLTYSASVATQYNALRDKIVGIVESTLYNGIALLDSGEWGTEQIDASGKVHIQSSLSSDPDSGGFDVTFRALDTIPWSTQLTGTDLGVAGTLQTQLDRLSAYIGDMTTQEELYSQREDGLNYQATALESQADLLDQAVEARRQTPTLSLEEILIRLLLRGTGTLMDENG
jgi:flagellin